MIRMQSVISRLLPEARRYGKRGFRRLRSLIKLLDLFVVRHKTAINTASDKSIIAQAVTDTTTKAIELSGGFGYLRKSPLQRFFRDSFASQFHPLQEKKQQSFTGRLAMGLEPVEVPEFD